MIRRRDVFVKGLRLEAAIGVHAHEEGRTQPLVVDAVIEMSLHEISSLRDTLNYEEVGRIARAHIARGHIRLVETLAEAIARDLCTLPHVVSAEVSVSKPEALSDADQAGCRVVFNRV